MNIITEKNSKNKSCNENLLIQPYQHMAETVLVDTVEFTLPRRYVVVPGETGSACRYREWSRGWVWTKMATTSTGVTTAVQNVAPKGPGPVRITIQTGQRRGWQDNRPITKAGLYAALNDILPHLTIMRRTRFIKRAGHIEAVHDYATPTLRDVIADMRVSRVDVAMDMSPEVLAPSIRVGQAVSGHLRGRKRRISPIRGADGRIETVYVGRRGAMLVAAIYDKQKQMRAKQKKIKPTTRMEIRFKREISLKKLVSLSKRCRRTRVRRERNGRGNSGWVGVSKREHCIISREIEPVETPKNKGSPRKTVQRGRKPYLREMNGAGPNKWPAVAVFGL